MPIEHNHQFVRYFFLNLITMNLIMNNVECFRSQSGRQCETENSIKKQNKKSFNSEIKKEFSFQTTTIATRTTNQN